MRTEPKEILDEIKKCQESPYYFATTYLKVNNKPFITPLSERQFNQYFFQGRMINEEELTHNIPPEYNDLITNNFWDLV